MNEIRGFEELKVTLGQMLRQSAAMRPVLMEIAQKQVSSFQENFRQGGRPDRWKESVRARKQGGMTLLDTGRLMKSITIPEVTNDSITFGSNVPYAPTHQFGLTVHYPARSENFTRKRVSDKDYDRALERGATTETLNSIRVGQFKRGTAKRERGEIGMTRKAYDVKFPERPFIVFQPADVQAAGKILLRNLLGMGRE